MLRSFSISEVITIFDWLGDLCSGIGDALSGAFSALWTEVSGSIWELFLKWIYTAIYNAVAEFFTSIGNMGADIFELRPVVVKKYNHKARQEPFCESSTPSTENEKISFLYMTDKVKSLVFSTNTRLFFMY